LVKGFITFGSLHSLFKLNAKVFDLWSSVLHALPTARLLVFRETLTGLALERVRQQFAERGIGENRLELRLGSDAPGYLRVYEEIDISLDAFPWTGGVTTCESLWMGVPMLTLCGQRPTQRNSTAHLARVGLTDWAAATSEEYVAKAVHFANEPTNLAALRQHLRERMKSTLCDAVAFTRSLEDGYRSMWRRWCATKT
jgi:predicted O-linked N-acetylglucosamine transferase (SPINDLY family)